MKTGTLKDFKVALKKGVGKNRFDSWYAMAYFSLEVVNGRKVLSLAYAKAFQQSYVNQHYRAEVERIAKQVLGGGLDICIRHDPDLKVVKEPLKEALPEAGQGSIFIPDIAEVSLRDDIHLMEIAPFTLNAKYEDRTVIKYEDVSGLNITVTALTDNEGVNYGLPSATDYDIVLMMQGCLMKAANDYHKAMDIYEKEVAAGKTPKRPDVLGVYFEPFIDDILMFTHTKKGGKQVDRIKDMLDRLANTKISLSRSTANKRRYGVFNLIDGWEVTASSSTGKLQQVRIGIPSWIYSGIVNSRNPAILKLDPDFIRLSSPILRALYRLCRIKGSQTSFEMSFDEVYHRMGSDIELKYFARNFNNALKPYKDTPFFDWNIRIDGVRKERKLIARRVDETLI